MDNVINQQLDFSRQLLEGLEEFSKSYDKSTKNLMSPAFSLVKLLKDMRFQMLIFEVRTYLDTKILKGRTKKSILENANKQLAILDSNTKLAKDLMAITSETEEMLKSAVFNSDKNLQNLISKSSSESIKRAARKLLKIPGFVNRAVARSKQIISGFKEGISKLVSINKVLGVVGFVFNLFKGIAGIPGLILSGVKSIYGFLKIPLKIIGAILGGMTSLAKFSMTIPFTLAKAVASAGGKIRESLASIQESGEEAKETFDMTSKIGRGAVKLTRFAKGSLKQFENPRSRLVKLFGMGAQAGSKLLSESFTMVDSMGHYGEIFGSSILGNSENALYLIEMQRAMGISAQDMSYYAMQSYNEGKHPVDTLDEISQTIKSVADENDFDFKAVAKGFHKVRTNIVEFGHLSNTEIGRLIGKLRKMKVSVDDATSVFKKFTTFEEAAKSSAMLFQAFEMNVDAFDLLTARDPAEMLTQFRDAMFQTGKSFKDLDRHEKALMQSITGISEKGLATLMNYMDMGLTQDEARKLMADQDPTKEQTKMIKGLGSVIKQFQKTLQFTSPFQAFYEGMMTNAATNKELNSSLIDLSQVYDDIRHLGFSLNLSEVNAMLAPITKILHRIEGLVCGGEFEQALQHAANTASNFFEEVSYDLQSSKESKALYSLNFKIQAMYELRNEKNKSFIEAADAGILKAFKKNIGIGTKSLNLDKNLIKQLTSSGVIKKLKGGVFQLADDLSAESLMNALMNASAEFANNPTVLQSLNNVRAAIEVELNDHISTMSKEAGEAIVEKATSRVTVEGRIENLYQKLLAMFDEGGSGGKIAKGFFDMGGNIMGSIIRGVFTGAAAMLSIFSGGAEKTVKSLNMPFTDAMKKDALDKKIPLSEYTLANWMGIDPGDSTALIREMTKETKELVSKWPTMMSLAGTLLYDLTAMFAQIGAGFAESVGAIIYEYRYKEDTSIFSKVGLGIMMHAIGGDKAYDREFGKKYSKKGKLGGLVKNIQETSLLTNENKFEDRSRIVNILLGVIDKMKRTADPNNMVKNFLDSAGVKAQIRFVETYHDKEKLYLENKAITKDTKFSNFHLGNMLLTILGNARKIDRQFEPWLYDGTIFAEQNKLDAAKKEVRNKQSAMVKGILKIMPSHMASKSGQPNENGPFSPARFGNADQGGFFGYGSKTATEVAQGMFSERFFKMVSDETGMDNYAKNLKDRRADSLKKKEKPAAVEDLAYMSFTGRGMVLMTPMQNYILDDADAVLAVKEGGFLNSLFIEASKSYTDTSQSIVAKFNDETLARNNEIVNANVVFEDIINLNNSIDNFEEEASQEDLIEIFEYCKSVVLSTKNRKVVANLNESNITFG